MPVGLDDRLREVVVGLISLVPEVGGPAAFIVGLIWPDEQPDIFESIKNDVRKLIKDEILKNEISNHWNDIAGLRETLREYVDAKYHDKESFLTTWIDKTNSLSEQFRRSPNNIHFIHLTITLAVFHLTALRERLIHGEKLFGGYDTIWKEKLEGMYKKYEEFFASTFLKWKQWREDQVKIETAWDKIPMSWAPVIITPRISYAGSLVDEVTGQKRNFIQRDCSNKDAVALKSRVEDVKRRICNQDISEMVDSISTTFSFARAFLPDNNPELRVYNKEVFGTVFLGPYFSDLSDVPDYQPNAILGPSDPVQNDFSTDSGPLTKMIIRDGAAIDAIQFIYAGREGIVGGNPTGGGRHEIDLKGDVKGFEMGFADGILIKVRIHYNKNGGQSDWYGNCTLPTRDYLALGPENYRVTSWSFAINRAGIISPSAITFQYESLFSTETTWNRDSSDWTSALLKEGEESYRDLTAIRNEV